MKTEQQSPNKNNHKRFNGLLKKWKFLEQIFEDRTLSLSDKVVAGRLLMHHNSQPESPHFDQCDFTSERKLADRLWLNKDSVCLAIKQLKQQGWLTANQPGRKKVNEYTFNWDVTTSQHPEIAEAEKLAAKELRRQKKQAEYERVYGKTGQYGKSVQSVRKTNEQSVRKTNEPIDEL